MSALVVLLVLYVYVFWQLGCWHFFIIFISFSIFFSTFIFFFCGLMGERMGVLTIPWFFFPFFT